MNIAKHTFFKLPKIIIFGEKYQSNLLPIDKIAYAVLNDRLSVSIKNGWVDNKGDVYFVYSNRELMKTLAISKSTLLRVKKRLKDANLLDEEITGRANRLYLIEPELSNKEEAEYILKTEDELLINKTKMTKEQKEKISAAMLNNKNAKKETGIHFKTSSEKSGDVSNRNLRSSIMENQESLNWDPSKNNLVRGIKDIKDNKDWENQNDLLTSGIENIQDIESSKELIDEFIENKSIEVIYGKPIIQNFLKYSKYDFLTFKTFYDKLFFAHKAVEDEAGVSIMLNEPITAYGEKHQLDLSKAFWRSIQKYKTNEIKKDFNNYLFGVFKGTFKEIADAIKSEREMYKRKQEKNKGIINHNYEEVPMINWLEEINKSN